MAAAVRGRGSQAGQLVQSRKGALTGTGAATAYMCE